MGLVVHPLEGAPIAGSKRAAPLAPAADPASKTRAERVARGGVEQLQVQVLLAAEVLVDQRFRHAGRGGDVVERTCS